MISSVRVVSAAMAASIMHDDADASPPVRRAGAGARRLRHHRRLGPPAPPRGARESRPALVAALTRRRHGAPLGRWDLAPPGIRLLHVEDAGVPPYPELVLAATRTNLREEPDVIRAAVRALARGYRFTLTDPESSLQDLVGRFPGLDAARARAALGRLTAAFLGDAGVPGVLDARQ